MSFLGRGLCRAFPYCLRLLILSSCSQSNPVVCSRERFFITFSWTPLVIRLPLHVSFTFWELRCFTRKSVVLALDYCIFLYSHLVASHSDQVGCYLDSFEKQIFSKGYRLVLVTLKVVSDAILSCSCLFV